MKRIWLDHKYKSSKYNAIRRGDMTEPCLTPKSYNIIIAYLTGCDFQKRFSINVNLMLWCYIFLGTGVRKVSISKHMK